MWYAQNTNVSTPILFHFSLPSLCHCKDCWFEKKQEKMTHLNFLVKNWHHNWRHSLPTVHHSALQMFASVWKLVSIWFAFMRSQFQYWIYKWVKWWHNDMPSNSDLQIMQKFVTINCHLSIFAHLLNITNFDGRKVIENLNAEKHFRFWFFFL